MSGRSAHKPSHYTARWLNETGGWRHCWQTSDSGRYAQSLPVGATDNACMADLTAEIASAVVTACQEGAEQVGSALSRAADRDFQVSVGEPGTYSPPEPPEGFDGAGLAVILKFGDAAMVAILPESSGLAPAWCAEPDVTEKSKLDTLAQELSMLVVPESLTADTFTTVYVDLVAAALAQANVAADAAHLPLMLTSGDQQGVLSLIWPIANPGALDPPEASSSGNETDDRSPHHSAATDGVGKIDDFSKLPSYSRSLLKIEIPVTVELAVRKHAVQEIVELGPGSIIKFEKSCEELLELCVGNRPVAMGEAVKVGDKFGVRIQEMLMPDEHFSPVRSSASRRGTADQ